MMKRTAGVGLVTIAISGILAVHPAASSEPGQRVVTREYTSPVVGVAWPLYVMEDCGVFVPPTNSYAVQGCVIVKIKRDERAVAVAAADGTAMPVALEVFQWNGLGGAEVRYVGLDACTTMEEPWRIRPWARYMWIEVLAGPCNDGTPALATQGTVEVTFLKGSR